MDVDPRVPRTKVALDVVSVRMRDRCTALRGYATAIEEKSRHFQYLVPAIFRNFRQGRVVVVVEVRRLDQSVHPNTIQTRYASVRVLVSRREIVTAVVARRMFHELVGRHDVDVFGRHRIFGILEHALSRSTLTRVQRLKAQIHVLAHVRRRDDAPRLRQTTQSDNGDRGFAIESHRRALAFRTIERIRQ